MIIENKSRKINKKNYTPLHYVAERNLTEIAELLISKGADINAKDIIYLNIIILFLIKITYNKLRKLTEKNKTPLHYAIKKSSKALGELLLSKGADINAFDIIYLNILLLFIINGII